MSRVGDLMHEVINSDFAMAKTDPLRNTRPVSEHGVRSGFGFESTWPAFAINWMTTEWELHIARYEMGARQDYGSAREVDARTSPVGPAAVA